MSAAPSPAPTAEEIASTKELLDALVQAKTAATDLVAKLARYERNLRATVPALAPRWSASPQAPCRTPGCERLAAEPAELAGGMISAETLDKLPPGDAARADRVNRRTQLEVLGLCFACADQIAQAPPLGEHVWIDEVCARCGARASETNSAHCVWRPRSLTGDGTVAGPRKVSAPQAQEAARRLEHEVMQLRDALATAHAEIAQLKSRPRAEALEAEALRCAPHMAAPGPDLESGR